VPLDRPVRHRGVTYRYFDTIPSGEWKLSPSLARWLRRHVGEYDVVHVHGLFSFSTIPACRTALANAVPYVIRPLGMLSAASLQFRSWKKKPYYALVERKHLANAAAIHVTSEQEESAVRSLGFGDRVRLVPLGVDAPALRRPARSGGDSVRFVFLGRLHPIKQVPLLLEAFEIASRGIGRIELTIVGGGDDAYRRSLEDVVMQRGLSAHVHFTGDVPHARVQELLSDADVLVLPSRTENFGLAAAEGLAAGLPVIVTDAVGLAADVARAYAGRVVSSDANALAQAISELATDSTLRTRMSANARRLADERFSWSRSADELIALYDAVTSAGHDAARLMEV